MATIYLDRAAGEAVGRDVDLFIGSSVIRAEGGATGFPVLVHGAPTVGSVPDALRLEVLDSAGVQIKNDLAERRGLSFSVEHNGSGDFTFETDLAALADGIDDPILDPTNLVRIHYGDLDAHPYGIAEGIITSAPPVLREDGWAVTVSGPGSGDVLALGELAPPAGATGDTREFSYTAGQTGPATIPAQWGKPYGVRVKSSFRWRNRYPRGWSESGAQWLWSSSPEKICPNGTRTFSGTLTLATAKRCRFEVAGDDNLRFYINGAKVKVKAAGAWKKKTTFIRTLPAGTHQIVGQVANVTGRTGDNKCGFICAVAELDSHGNRVRWLLRSTTSTFKVMTVPETIAQVPLPPDGWYAPAVLAQHVGEAAARGVAYHPQIVRTYSYTADSSSSAWATKGPVEYDIGISGSDLTEKIRALGYDVAMLPGLRLSAWKRRGFDLRDRVTIGTPATVAWTSRNWARVRTVGYTHHESGWTETAGDPAVAAEFGRRELTISGGGQDGDVQADVFATAAMSTAASPEETLEVTIGSASVSSPQPFRDFNLADIVSVATVGGYTPMKVMSIRGAEDNDNKSVTFTIAGYPV